MKLKPETVAKVVKGWNIVFPYRKTDAEMAYFSTRVFEHCQTIFSNEGFIEAARILEAEQDQFPTISSIVKLGNVIAEKEAREISSNAIALPEHTDDITPEEIEQNKKRIDILRKQLTGELSMEQAEAEQKKLTTYARTN